MTDLINDRSVDRLTAAADQLGVHTRTVDLQLATLKISTNVADFPAHAYLPVEAPAATVADYELVCIENEGRFDAELLSTLTDATYRAKRFRQGFYLVHYFGEPAFLITRGRRFYVFGTKLERTVWPYFVKYILTRQAIDQAYLHLKGAALAQDDAGVLLFGGNGAGKTVFLAQACAAGADFVSNTHLMVRDGRVHGVHSSLRVRDDACFAEVISRSALTAHMEKGDFLAAPADMFGEGRVRRSAAVRTLVIADFRPDTGPEIEEFEPQRMIRFLRQFAAVLPVYGLKDDVLDYFGGDVNQFTDWIERDDAALRELVDGARCLRVNADMLDPTIRARVLTELFAR